MNIWRFLEQLFTWYVRWSWWMWGKPLMLLIALRALFHVARISEGWKQRAVTAGLPRNADTDGFVRLRSIKNGRVLAERQSYNASFDNVSVGPTV